MNLYEVCVATVQGDVQGTSVHVLPSVLYWYLVMPVAAGLRQTSSISWVATPLPTMKSAPVVQWRIW